MFLDKTDRYILRQFILTFFFGVLAFSVIYIAVNLMEKLGDLIDRNVPTLAIIKYYIYLLPDIIQLLVPIGMLLASLFTIGKIDTTHELTAIRAAGRSMRRVAAPLLAFGLTVSCFMIYFNGWLVPITNKEVFAIERQYLGKNIMGGQRNVHLRLSPTLNLQMDYFNPETAEANLVSLERFDTAAQVVFAPIPGTTDTAVRSDTVSTIKITERIDAATMRFDSVTGGWEMLNGIARNFADQEHINTTMFASRKFESLPITPDELNLSQQNIKELTVEEFRDRIEQERLSGRNVDGLMVDYFAKFAFPFSAVIVIFFGIPFSSNQRKSGAAATIAVTGIVSAIYMVLSEVSKTFSYGGMLPPYIIAWMANIVFLLVGLLNLYRVERG